MTSFKKFQVCPHTESGTHRSTPLPHVPPTSIPLLAPMVGGVGTPAWCEAPPLHTSHPQPSDKCHQVTPACLRWGHCRYCWPTSQVLVSHSVWWRGWFVRHKYRPEGLLQGWLLVISNLGLLLSLLSPRYLPTSCISLILCLFKLTPPSNPVDSMMVGVLITNTAGTLISPELSRSC